MVREGDFDKGEYYDSDDMSPRPSMFLHHWASRILLEITEVRAERLQEISLKDTRAEGMRHEGYWAGDTWHTSTGDFHFLWDSLNAKRKPTKYDREHGIRERITPSYAWASNPWVWVISFKIIKGGIDADS